MQFDRTALERLLMLNDKQLETVVKKLAEDYGLDLTALNIDATNMKKLRQALRQVSSGSLHDRVIVQTLLGNFTQSQAAKLIGISQPQVCRELKKMRLSLQSQIELPALEE